MQEVGEPGSIRGCIPDLSPQLHVVQDVLTSPERLSCIDGVYTAILRGSEDDGWGVGMRSNAVDCIKMLMMTDWLTAVCVWGGGGKPLMGPFISINELTF